MPSTSVLTGMYDDMVTARYYEERLQEDYLEGKQPVFDISAGPIPGELHLTAGHEASGAGVCQHLRDDDTVTNLGVLSVDSFTPIINPPEIAILGVNRRRNRVRPTDTGVEFRPAIHVDLTFDHRVINGADAGRFLESFVGHIEDAETSIVE